MVSDPDEIESILDTFQIIADTREQNTNQAAERFKSFGFPVQRATLSYGDYCGNILLPNGKWLLDVSSTVNPMCVVVRKMSLDELASCFTSGRNRFRKEFERAAESGAKIYLLTENGSWEGIMDSIQKHL